ncbi:hypothetical protein H6790_01245 [Candidatus Nomurabacteria bacterium]|nr:hypothetical protein [Candidatus Nomurabacteria bacterium]
MKKRFKLLLPAFLAAVALTSCSKSMVSITTAYTKDSADTSAVINKQDLMATQVYLKGSFTLTRNILDGEKSVKPERIKVVDGQQIEEITFEDGLPVIIQSFNDSIAMVMFEEDCECTIRFGPNGSGVYQLMAVLRKSNSGTYLTLKYEGKVWGVKYSFPPTLEFNLLREKKVKKDSRSADGVKMK